MNPFLASFPFFILRLSLGILFAFSGWGKWMHLDQAISFFESLHIPFAYIQAPMVASVELLGGLALLLGVGVRVFSFLLAAVMAVALLTAVFPQVHTVSEIFSVPEWYYLLILLSFVGGNSDKMTLENFLKSRKIIK